MITQEQLKQINEVQRHVDRLRHSIELLRDSHLSWIAVKYLRNKSSISVAEQELSLDKEDVLPVLEERLNSLESRLFSMGVQIS